MNEKLAFAVIVSLIQAHGGHANHFMGGSMFLRPTQTLNSFQFETRTAWKQNNTSQFICNEFTLLTSEPMHVDGTIQIKGCKDETITSINLVCTDYSEMNNWLTGTYTRMLMNSCNKPTFEVRFEGNHWPNLRNGGGEMRLTMKATLNNRPKSSIMNSTPIFLIQPIIRLLFGCKQVIKIPVIDGDNDILRCRWSQKEPVDECGGICERLPWMTLNEQTCTFEYFPNMAPLGTYAIAIQLEDFMKESDTVPMSSVPIQFSIEIIQANVTCEQIPTEESLTFSKDLKTDISVGKTYRDIIIARSKENAPAIKAIETQSPRGTKKTLPRKYEADLTGRSKYINISWTPTQDQSGRHLLSAYIIDEAGLSSPVISITLNIVNNTSTTYVNTTEEDGGISVEAIVGIISVVVALIGIVVSIIIHLKRR